MREFTLETSTAPRREIDEYFPYTWAMVVFGNRKYACLTCIRGHRSSSCEHRDRILLQIRKPGRKPQAEPQGRFALVWTDNNSGTAPSAGSNSKNSNRSKKLSESEYKLIRVPNVGSITRDEESTLEKSPGGVTEDDDEIVMTEKYMFVHIGDNLFRREVRPEYAAELARKSKMESSPGESLYSSTVSSPEALNLSLLNAQDSEPHSCHKLRVPLYEPTENTHDAPPTMHAGSMHSEISHTQNGNMEIPDVSNGAPSEVSSGSHDPRNLGMVPQNNHQATAPLVIGPMQFQNDFMNQQANIFNELGITEEEASTLWPDNPSIFSFASQCVLPGQCKCGDSCECPDCHEHNGAHHQHQH